MENLRYKWLKFRGYEPFRYVTVASSWNGEDPPAFGYYSELLMAKGVSIKKVKFKNIQTGAELRDFIRERG